MSIDPKFVELTADLLEIFLENEIKTRPGNTTLFHQKRYEEGAQGTWSSSVQTELTWPRVSTQPQHRVPPFAQLTRQRLQTKAVAVSSAACYNW